MLASHSPDRAFNNSITLDSINTLNSVNTLNRGRSAQQRPTVTFPSPPMASFPASSSFPVSSSPTPPSSPSPITHSSSSSPPFLLPPPPFAESSSSSLASPPLPFVTLPPLNKINKPIIVQSRSRPAQPQAPVSIVSFQQPTFNIPYPPPPPPPPPQQQPQFQAHCHPYHPSAHPMDNNSSPQAQAVHLPNSPQHSSPNKSLEKSLPALPPGITSPSTSTATATPLPHSPTSTDTPMVISAQSNTRASQNANQDHPVSVSSPPFTDPPKVVEDQTSLESRTSHMRLTPDQSPHTPQIHQESYMVIQETFYISPPTPQGSPLPTTTPTSTTTSISSTSPSVDSSYLTKSYSISSASSVSTSTVYTPPPSLTNQPRYHQASNSLQHSVTLPYQHQIQHQRPATTPSSVSSTPVFVPKAAYVTSASYVPASTYAPITSYVPSTAYVPSTTYVPRSTYVPKAASQQRPTLESSTTLEAPEAPQQQPQPEQPIQPPLHHPQPVQYQPNQEQPVQQVVQQQQPAQPHLPEKTPLIPSTSMDRAPSPSAIVPALGIPSPNRYPSVNPNFGFITNTSVTHNTLEQSFYHRSPSPNTQLRSDRPQTPPQWGQVSSPPSSTDDNRQSHHHLRAVSPVPPQASIGVNTTRKKRVQGRSEDWGALVDSPESPILSHAAPNFHPYQQQQLPQQPFLGLTGYSDSPAEESSPSRDYMQHPYASVPGSEARPHAQTDPTSRGHPYRHQQHYSTSSVPMAYTGNMGPNDRGMTMPNIGGAKPQRRSWTPSTFEALGHKTPPLSGHSKRSSVAMSVSLLNDASVVAKYREMAVKTNDASVQLSYAKYLLQIGGPLDPNAPLPAVPTPPVATQTNGSPNSRAPSPIPPMPQVSTHGLSDEAGKRQLTQEGMYWIEKLAKEGQPEAQFIRGTWHEHGLYQTKKSMDKANRYYQSASKGDYGPAHYKVGYSCEHRKDNNKAVVLYKKAAIHNDVPANHRLAIVYLHGEMGQNKNLKAGLQYLKRAATLADENSPKAPYVLGQILSREYKATTIPDDVAFPDDGEALEWFRKSAQLGYGPANFKIGSCYEYGTLGCTIDPIMSVQHYERAIVAGDSNGEAEMALSGWYLSGADHFFEADDKLAFEYASKAAEKKLPKAQYAMGYYHEVGISAPADILKAMEFYRLAAAAGNKEAKARLSKDMAFDRLGHQKSIRRIKQGRKTKDQNCPIM